MEHKASIIEEGGTSGNRTNQSPAMNVHEANIANTDNQGADDNMEMIIPVLILILY